MTLWKWDFCWFGDGLFGRCRFVAKMDATCMTLQWRLDRRKFWRSKIRRWFTPIPHILSGYCTIYHHQNYVNFKHINIKYLKSVNSFYRRKLKIDFWTRKKHNANISNPGKDTSTELVVEKWKKIIHTYWVPEQNDPN